MNNSPAKNESKVSVLLPVYNVAKYLPTAIESVLDQTHRNWELLISDNASQDETYIIAEKYGKSDPRIKLSRNERNIGSLENFNKCIAQASGDYIELFGGDDIFEPRCIEVLADLLDEHPTASLATAAKIYIDANGKELGSEPFSDQPGLTNSSIIIKDCVEKLINRISSPVMYRACYKGSGFDAAFFLYADIDYWITIMRQGDIISSQEILLKCRRHPISATSMSCEDLSCAIDLIRMFDRHGHILMDSSNAELRYQNSIVEKLLEILDYSKRSMKLNFKWFYESDLAANLSGQMQGLYGAENKMWAKDNEDLRRLLGLSLEYVSNQKNAHKLVLDQLNSKLDNLNQELQSIRSSQSWKMTSPLRWFKSLALRQ